MTGRSTNSDGAAQKRSGGWWRIGIVALVVLGLTAAGIFLPLKDYFGVALHWVQGLGYWGPVVVVLLYVVASVLSLPGSVLTIGAGAIFRLFLGTVTVSVGATLGACAAFWVGRTVARGWVAKKVQGNPKFAAIDAAVAREGFKIVLLTRLCPIFPFNLLNYAFSLTRVRFRTYALASWIGMLPGTLLYVYIGAVAGDLTEALSGKNKHSGTDWILRSVGLVVAAAIVVLITRIARRALKEATPGGVQGGKEPHG
jgi:uncharacterized membrane protein YdjX (TVP38/TMEM64 family)